MGCEDMAFKDIETKREYARRYVLAYRLSNPEYLKKGREASKRFNHSEKGRLSYKKHDATRNGLAGLNRIAKDYQREVACFICRYNDIDVLEIEHPNNDGHIERGKNRSAYTTHRKIRTLKTTVGLYGILCANCNRKKQRLFYRTKYSDNDKKIYNDFIKPLQEIINSTKGLQ